MTSGQCGEEYWIADELWQIARRQPVDYAAFVNAVVSMLTVTNNKKRQQSTRATSAPQEPQP